MANLICEETLQKSSKPSNIYIVTGNAGKVHEFRTILGSRPDILYRPFNGEEIQGTPQQIIKAKALAAWTSIKAAHPDCRMILVEDTSLFISSLDVSGPYIKEWLSKIHSKGIYEKARILYGADKIPASAESWICVYDGSDFIIRVGRTKGMVVSPSGTNGFGWDDIFVAEGEHRTFAEMSPDEKNQLSPRRKAIEQIRPHLRYCNVDTVVGTQWGDEGKGKIVNFLLTTSEYTHGIRWQGSCNAGHTIYIMHNGERTQVITHMVPSTVLHGITSIIGDACKIDHRKLEAELVYLTKYVPNVRDLVKISANCGIISEAHIAEDAANDTVGTTRSGVGPCNRDYYDRKCQRVKDLMTDGRFCGCEVILNTAEYWMKHDYVNAMAEGAQAYELSVTGCNYPYVTSTHCDAGFLNTVGINPHCIGTIYGAAKLYATYVGTMEFGNQDDQAIKQIQEAGQEFGATTGRRRKVDWLDITRLRTACHALGVTHLIINKCDIIDQLKFYKLYRDGRLIEFNKLRHMMEYIEEYFDGWVKTIKFSFSPDRI